MWRACMATWMPCVCTALWVRRACKATLEGVAVPLPHVLVVDFGKKSKRCAVERAKNAGVSLSPPDFAAEAHMHCRPIPELRCPLCAACPDKIHSNAAVTPKLALPNQPSVWSQYGLRNCIGTA